MGTVDVIRGYLCKSLFATVEFIIESEKASLPDQPVSPELVIFYITQDTQGHSLLPKLRSVDGDVCHNITLPIYIILPCLLTCPTIYASPFSIKFKVLIVITFQSELLKLNPKSDPRTPRPWLAMESVSLEPIQTK
ncbi:Vacuolar protein sorting-associated protein 26C [Camellia lanceoleosa]|uniref:Vacuolar protein sorting-associated protein 26C n=1 Tax=Camellia lanceoleosa TaxID=1840588 RepID=A0ACC0IZ60_9ERIC|nr:Vacuolar protein sorting-associated protein 26C [Camellia lanceoleosa]